MADLKAFAEQLVNLSVKDVNELAKILKEEYGIEPAADAVVAGMDLFQLGADQIACGGMEVFESGQSTGPRDLSLTRQPARHGFSWRVLVAHRS